MEHNVGGNGLNRRDLLRRFALGLIVAIGLILAAVRIAGMAAGYTMSLERPGFLVLALGAEILAVVTGALLWRVALEFVSSVRLEFLQSLLHTGIVLAAKYIPGKLWGLMGRGFHARRLGIGLKEIYLASLFEQIALVLTAILLVGLSRYREDSAWVVLIVAFGAWLLCLSWTRLTSSAARVLRTGRAGAMLASLDGSSIQLCSPNFVLLTGLALVQWLSSAVVLVALVLSLGGTYSSALAVAALGAGPAAMLVGLVFFFVPGGIGVREGVIVLFLQPVLGMEVALMASILSRLWSTVRDVGLGAWSIRALR